MEREFRAHEDLPRQHETLRGFSIATDCDRWREQNAAAIGAGVIELGSLCVWFGGSFASSVVDFFYGPRLQTFETQTELGTLFLLKSCQAATPSGARSSRAAPVGVEAAEYGRGELCGESRAGRPDSSARRGRSRDELATHRPAEQRGTIADGGEIRGGEAVRGRMRNADR